MPTVSVVIPAYNSSDVISEAIESVLSQTYKDFEIIVVDDGGTDNTEEIIRSYDFPVNYIKQENGGAAVARNTGMHAARGDYIALLDSDDIWLPSKLEKQIEFLERETDVGVVCCDGFRWTPPSVPAECQRLSALRGVTPSRPSLEFMFKVHLILTSSVVFRRKLLETVGYMNPKLKHGQDVEFFIRLAAKTSLAYMDIPLKAYRVHCANTSSLITHENIRRRIRAHLTFRYATLEVVPQLKEYRSVRIFLRMPALIQYVMVVWWRFSHGGSIKYLSGCIFNYVRKFLG